MPRHKIVIKYQNGKIVKGWIDNFSPNRDLLFLHPLKEYSQKETLEIKIQDLKAIFFVKDFLGNKNYQKVRTFAGFPWNIPTQKKIIVYFKDGEKLYGTSYSYNPRKIGFFIYPVGPQDNNIRIFAVNKATEKVEFPDVFIDSYFVQDGNRQRFYKDYVLLTSKKIIQAYQQMPT